MLEQLGKNAKEASRVLMTASTTQKNAALSAIAAAFRQNKDYILEENEKDLAAARENGMAKAMLDRLALNDVRVQGLSDAATPFEEDTGLSGFAQSAPAIAQNSGVTVTDSAPVTMITA